MVGEYDILEKFYLNCNNAHMESIEGNPIDQSTLEQPKTPGQESYPVRLRTHLINHVAAQLTPSFDQEKLAIQQQDGSYQELMDFVNNSPFGSLMQRLREQPEDPNNIPHDRVIDLSQGDIALIKSKATPPPINDYAGFRAHKEMMEELEMKFGSAKTSAQIKNTIDKVKGFVRGK